MNCGRCNLIIEDVQPKTTLMCGHILHTRCFIINVIQREIEYIQCNTCSEKVVTEDINKELYPIRDRNILAKLQESSEEFRNIISTTIIKYKECIKAEKKFKIKSKPIINEYKLNVRPQIQILKNYIKSKKKDIKSLEEYKELTKKRISLICIIKKILDKYNVSSTDFKLYMRQYNNINIHRSSIVNLYYNLSIQLNRKFRVRL
jgi:hypothetical protein